VLLSYSASHDANDPANFNIITQLGSRLYLILCDSEILIDTTKVPCLNLRVCILWRISDFCKLFFSVSTFDFNFIEDQFKRVLSNHKMKKLVFQNIYRWSDSIFDGKYFSIKIQNGANSAKKSGKKLGEKTGKTYKKPRFLPYFAIS
jgi:hypothetical protein